MKILFLAKRAAWWLLLPMSLLVLISIRELADNPNYGSKTAKAIEVWQGWVELMARKNT